MHARSSVASGAVANRLASDSVGQGGMRLVKDGGAEGAHV
jgi:hypothetical protein